MSAKCQKRVIMCTLKRYVPDIRPCQFSAPDFRAFTGLAVRLQHSLVVGFLLYLELLRSWRVLTSVALRVLPMSIRLERIPPENKVNSIIYLLVML